MGSKIINTGDLAGIPLTYSALEAETAQTGDGIGELSRQILANVTTSGAGDLADNGADELAALIFSCIETALFINSQEYDLDAASAALLAAQG